MTRRSVSVVVRIGTLILLTAATLFYLQFGLQALWQSVPQGILTLVGTVALAWGVILTFKRRPASGIVFLGTIPLLIFHAVLTLIDPGELPFLIGSIPVPLLAGLAWLVTRRGTSE